MSLVKSNTTDLIQETTLDGFQHHAKTNDVLGALKILTKLRGIGPATASLLLSVYEPSRVPFFSDELFRWTHWDSTGKTGWERSIKYNVTEYKELLASVEGLRKRLDVAAVDCEKVAYVLGKERVDIDGEGDDEGEEEVDEEEAEDRIGGRKSNENTKEQGSLAEAAAKADAAVDNKMTKDGYLDGTGSERDKRKGTVEEKTISRKRKAVATADGKDRSNEEEEAKSTAKKGTKRKVDETKPVAEGTRRSTRRKA
jgi:hypothetical protein